MQVISLPALIPEIPRHLGEVVSPDPLQSLLESLRHLNLTGLVVREGPVTGAFGGYCDMFYGVMMLIPSGGLMREKKVAIKRLRVHILQERDFAKVIGEP